MSDSIYMMVKEGRGGTDCQKSLLHTEEKFFSLAEKREPYLYREKKGSDGLTRLFRIAPFLEKLRQQGKTRGETPRER